MSNQHDADLEHSCLALSMFSDTRPCCRTPSATLITARVQS
jgi:hypothetical protein